ncbi:response regulator [Fervidibacillus halotolerans]|uniref:Response regulator n=1 Tax=Fervidibacillus halotolerans TaxID=2980027 RepID=A0A9E8RYR0_9BACI|nr:response regulator [Fervidibacillus halotolerans]WAA12528.1 response regulator [Fervidibacillus halotolerans]
MDLKILLVDDEMIERKAMKKIIESHFGKGIVCGEAANGRQAIQMAEELHPNVILMDVKMPGINGLEAIEIIRKKYPEMKFIMVSAYDSFDYAKRAMKEGVKEYILKPASKEETIEALLKVYQEIVQEEKQLEKERESKIIAEKHFLHKLMDFDFSEELEKIKLELFPDMQAAFFMVIEFENDEDQMTISKKINEWSEGSFIQDEKNDQQIYFITNKNEVEKAELLTFARKLFLLGKGRKWIGVGYPYFRLEEMPKSFKEARIALSQMKENPIGSYGFPNLTSKHSKVNFEKIIDALLQNETYMVMDFIQQIFKIEEKNEILQELYFSIRNQLREKGIELEQIQIKNILSLDDWQEFINLCSLQARQFFSLQGYVDKAKKYIQNRFNDSISLEEVAEHVKLSTPYFAKLFKEETGKTYTDYLTELRMRRAKELLLNTDLTFKEISFQVGYRDPNYFSRVFKKYFNLSPREYQSQMLKK